MQVKKILLFWLPMPFIGVINGIFRQVVILKYVNDFQAHQLSTFTLIALLAIYIYAVQKKLPIVDNKDAWITGSMWLLLTVAFEFGLGFFVSRLTFQQMLADYNIFEGRLWPVVLLSILILPVVYHILSKRKHIPPR
jgi:hypothetical protein